MGRPILLSSVLSCALLIMSSAGGQARQVQRPTQPKAGHPKQATKPTQQTATTKDGKTVILKSDGTWEYATESPRREASQPDQPKPDTGEPKPWRDEVRKTPLPYEEWRAFVKGQKVVLLKVSGTGKCRARPYRDEEQYDPAEYDKERKLDSLEHELIRIGEERFDRTYGQQGISCNEYNARYAGKTGTLLDARARYFFRDGSWYGFRDEYIVTLDDTGEKLAVLGLVKFPGELEIARAYVGRTVWARSSIKLDQQPPGLPPESRIWPEPSFFVSNIARMTVSRAEWKSQDNDEIYMCFKTDDGREGCRFETGYFDARFHREEWFHLFDMYYRNAVNFHYSDPKKAHPAWPKRVWVLIEKSEVAIGMTQEMAEVACGGLIERGAILSNRGSGTIFEGCGHKFLVDGGKVVKYVVAE